MSGKQTTALIIIFIYMALTIVLGLVVSKRKAAKQAKQSNEDFLMAGKSLGPLVLAGTLFAANTGGASTTGIATNVYSYGISACWYVIAAGIGFVLVSFIAHISVKHRQVLYHRLSENVTEKLPTFLLHLLLSQLCSWQQEHRLLQQRPLLT